MKFFALFSLLMVTLLARNRKHYLVKVEDKNEIIDENEENQNKEEDNTLNHVEENSDERENVKTKEVFRSDRISSVYIVNNV